MRTRLASLAVLAALIPVCASTSRAQDKVLLKDIAAVGDLYETDDQMSTNVKVRVAVPGQAEQSMTMLHREHEQYRTRVLAAAGGNPTAIRRTYMLSRTVDTGPEGRKERSSSLHGKTVTATRAGDRVTIAVDKGTLDPEDAEKVRKVVKTGKVRFMPGREVAVGEEWTIDPELAKNDLPGAQNVVATGKLTELVDYMGHRCAKIAVTFDVTGKFGSTPFPMHLLLSGDGYYALDLKRTLALRLSGPITANGETEQNGVRVSYTVDGTMEARSTEKWASTGK